MLNSSKTKPASSSYSSFPSTSISGIQGQPLEVTVIGCNKLKDTEWISRQDPYVCLEYASTKYRTRTCTDGSKNPTFQEKFVFTLIEGLREIWNSNTLAFDDFIGSGKVKTIVHGLCRKKEEREVLLISDSVIRLPWKLTKDRDFQKPAGAHPPAAPSAPPAPYSAHPPVAYPPINYSSAGYSQPSYPQNSAGFPSHHTLQIHQVFPSPYTLRIQQDIPSHSTLQIQQVIPSHNTNTSQLLILQHIHQFQHILHIQLILQLLKIHATILQVTFVAPLFCRQPASQ